MTIKHIRHTGIVVKDLDRSISFYRDLGFAVVSREKVSIGGKKLDTCKLRGPPHLMSYRKYGNYYSPLIELIQDPWFPHIAVGVDNLDAYSWGQTVHQTPGHRICFIEDPDGNKIELVEEI